MIKLDSIYYRLFRMSLYFTGLAILYPVSAKAQTQSFNIQQEGVRAAALSDEGLPERGEFVFFYAYNGEDIEALVKLSKKPSSKTSHRPHKHCWHS